MSTTTAWHDRLDVGTPSTTCVTAASSGPAYTSDTHAPSSTTRSTGT